MIRRTLLLLPLFAVILCACRQKSDSDSVPSETQTLAATVPTQARTVVRADLDGMLKMADCRSQGGKITLTPELSRLLAGWQALPLLEAAASNGDRLDLTETYLIDLGNGFEPVLTARLRQPAADQEEMQAESLSGGVAWLSDGRQAWLSIAPDPDLAEAVDSIGSWAERANLLSEQGIEHELFSHPSALSGMRRCERVANPMGEAFDAVFVNVDISDRALSAEARFACEGAWVDVTGMMRPIDPESALANLPPGCVLIASGGFTSDVVSRLIAAIASKEFDRRYNLSTYSRLLAVNGTATLAVAPGGRAETMRDFSPRHWAVRLSIPIEGDPVRALDFADHCFPDFYAQADSQALCVTTYDTGFYGSRAAFDPEIAPASRLSLSASIPYQSETMKALRLRSGYAVDIQADSAVSLSLRVLGPASYLLPALISDLTRQEK